MKKAIKKTKAPASAKTAEFKTYTDVKTVEDAYQVMGYKLSQRPDVKNVPQHLKEAITSEFDLWVVHEAVNKIMGFVPDYTNYDQRKWWTWRYIQKVKKSKKHFAGLGFSGTDTYCDYTHTDVGPRLCTADEKSALYIAEKFEALYLKRWF